MVCKDRRCRTRVLGRDSNLDRRIHRCNRIRSRRISRAALGSWLLAHGRLQADLVSQKVKAPRFEGLCCLWLFRGSEALPFYTLNDDPQPQVLFTWGLSNLKPAP